MNSSHCQCNHESLQPILGCKEVGAYSFGIAEAAPVEDVDNKLYDAWLEQGFHDNMGYMENHRAIRLDPSLLLDNAKSVIVCAFPYTRPIDVEWQSGSLRIASYALGDDYHDVVRRRLEIAVARMKEKWGGEYRICVDTAPFRERYWAARSGLGYIALNGLLMVPGAGSCFFLGSIITTIDAVPDKPSGLNCGNCRRCLACCPAGALVDAPLAEGKGRTFVDARKCLSCFTIEHRGKLPEGLNLGNRLYGCDTCQSVCPHNRLTESPDPLPEFEPRPELLGLTKEKVLEMTHEEYCRLFKGSAIKRAKLDGLRRNARHCK